LTGLFMVRYPKLPSVHSPIIGYVLPDSPAAKAGIQEGDQIVQIDNEADPTWEDVQLKELASAGHDLDVWFVRQGERKHISLMPSQDPKNGVGFAGWEEQNEIELARVAAGMGAAQAGLKQGDILISVNGQAIRSTPKLHSIISNGDGKPVQVVFSRDGQQQEATVTPRKEKVDGSEKWMIGVQLQAKVIFVPLPLPQALLESVRQNAKSASIIAQFLRGIVEQRMSPKSLEGPIGIAQLSGDAAREGPTAFFGLMSMVSLNLAIFNLLPIPILDGGVILLLLVEMFMRRDLSMRVKEAVFKLGFVFLMAVVAFVLYNDISKLAG